MLNLLHQSQIRDGIVAIADKAYHALGWRAFMPGTLVALVHKLATSNKDFQLQQRNQCQPHLWCQQLHHHLWLPS